MHGLQCKPNNSVKLSTLDIVKQDIICFTCSAQICERITSRLQTGYQLFRDLGDTLHSDHKRTNIINREEAGYCIAQFDKLLLQERGFDK